MSTPCENGHAFRQLLNALPSSVLLVDQRLRVVCANRNFLTKSRRTEAQTIGRHLAEVFPTVILERTDMAVRIRKVFRDGQTLRGRRIAYRAPGIPLRIYYYSLAPLADASSIETVMLFLEDVTEQVRLAEEVRRVEDHLASVVESASDLVLSVNISGHILTWNSAAESLTGLGLADVLGRYLWEICNCSARAEVCEVLLGTLSAGAGARACECRLTPPTGASVLVSWMFSPMKDDRGAVIGAVAVGRDLTERRKLEQQLRQSQKLAALGVMAGGIAHEIRNPLAVCSSAAQFLMEDDLPDDFRRDCAEKVQTGLLKASEIIENLLRFARPSVDEDMGEVDLVAVLHDTIDLIENQARVQKICVHRQLPEPPVSVRGVASLLQQVFMNLALNAINAMPSGGDLSVALTLAESEIEVQVTDTGVGIPESELEHIFDPFHRGSSPGWGTGLGLSISYSIVQRHLGRISARSKVGEGSCFTVGLPLL
ncbi:PAS domain-containing protein [uncultured Thiohalocapsa sp.]|uniref:PAS domain-containing protein n=1 Tax=uncultured Thiohalocapsa sp. TaxID=768990 RepID=UPI0025D9F9D4|nr:PAS domain-containing protein [uncultured Thiohalocapsa sp.]